MNILLFLIVATISYLDGEFLTDAKNQTQINKKLILIIHIYLKFLKGPQETFFF